MLNLLRITLVVLLIAGLPLGTVHAGNERALQRSIPSTFSSDDITGGVIASDAGGRFFLSIQIRPDKVLFHDENSTLVESRPLDKTSRVFISPKGNYICIESLNPIPTKGTPGVRSSAVYDRSGNEVWRVSQQAGYELSLPQFVLSDKDGSAAELAVGSQTLTIRDSHGSIVSTIPIFEHPKYDLEMRATLSMSEDGEYIAALVDADVPIPLNVERRGRYGKAIPARSGKPQLVLFDRTGAELWRRALDEFGGGLAVHVSPTGAFVIAGNTTDDAQKGIVHSGIYVYTRNGILLGKYSIHAPGNPWHPQFAVSPDGRFIALANLDRVLVLDSRTRTVLWDTTLPLSSPSDKRQMIRDIQFLGDQASLVIAIGTRIDGGPTNDLQLVILNEVGSIIHRTESCGIAPNFQNVTVAVTQNGEEVGVLTTAGLWVLQR